MEEEAIETSGEVMEPLEEAASEIANEQAAVDLSGIEELLDGIDSDLLDGFEGLNDSLGEALSGIASVQMFTFAALLLILGVLLFLVFSVTIRRL